ncbi:MAG: plasmid segregation centromere-binding protein ParR [Calothrix sp. C42_A2020_038]|nr:plasmid segregation centromere-binding protein ParR [Calothrix sp. C42_A2020_038]
MFQWSKKVVKSVTFNPGVADESLLALVESHLEKDPDKSFSDLCKEALWQALCVPESVRPNQKTASTPPPTQTPPPPLPANGGGEPQIADLHRQINDLEGRYYSREANRLDAVEHQLIQLSQQVAQLAIMVTQGVTIQVAPTQSSPAAEAFNTTNVSPVTPIAEVDPVISRLSQLVDDF